MSPGAGEGAAGGERASMPGDTERGQGAAEPPDVSVPDRWMYWSLGIGLFLLGVLVWTPYPAGVWHDDGVYVLLGRALALGGGLEYTGVAGAPPAAKFPPLYPLTLAGLWGLFSEVGRVTVAADLLNLTFLAAAGAFFARLLHRHLGASLLWAVGLTGLAWLPLALWRTALVPFSEPLFLLFLVLAVTAACRVEERPGDRLALALFVAATLVAVHVRTIGVVLVAAGAGALLLQGRRREAGAAVAAVGAGILPWTLWSVRAGGQIPEPLRDVLGPYGPWLLEQVRAHPTAYLDVLHQQARDLVHRTATVLVPGPPALEPWFDVLRWGALVVLVPALVLGFDRLWKRSRTAVLLLVGYLAVVWLWPFRDDRLLAPVAPFLILAVAEGFRWSGEGSALPVGKKEEAGRTGAPGPGGEKGGEEGAPGRLTRIWRRVGLGWAGLFAGVSLWGMAAGWPGAGYEIRSGMMARTVRVVDDAAPRDAVVGAPELWAGLHLYTGRTVSPSARFLPVRPDAPVWGTPEEQYRLWTEAGIDHLVLEGAQVHSEALDRLADVCGDEALRLVASWEGGALVRLAWGPECRRRLTASPD